MRIADKSIQNAADRGEKGRADSRNSRNEAEKSVHDAVARRDSDDKPFMNLSKMSAGQLDGTEDLGDLRGGIIAVSCLRRISQDVAHLAI